MGVRHRSTVPNGTIHVDDLEAADLSDVATGALEEWLDSLGMHPSRVAAVSVKFGAVKLLLNVRNERIESPKGPTIRTVRQWHNMPGAEPPPFDVWAPLLAAVTEGVAS